MQFRKDPSGSDYIEGTTFEIVYHLYKVDEIIRLEELEAAKKEVEKVTGEKQISQKMFKAI